MGKLTGKTAVVTGASKGIGASIAEHLAAEGASVAVNYSSSKTGADAVVKRITDKGGKAVAVQGDVSKPDDIGRLFAAVQAAFGRVDILVNNAGITSSPRSKRSRRSTSTSSSISMSWAFCSPPGKPSGIWARAAVP